MFPKPPASASLDYYLHELQKIRNKQVIEETLNNRRRVLRVFQVVDLNHFLQIYCLLANILQIWLKPMLLNQNETLSDAIFSFS